MKKAAMFGLDARIALAIFGALSVISGAALYSAIQDAKVTATIVRVEEIGKAIEQYLLDTGSDVAISSANHFNIVDLIEEPSGVTGWNGPYLSYAKNTSFSLRLVDSSGVSDNFLLRYAPSGDWADATAWPTGCTSSTKPCDIYVELESSESKNPGLSDAIGLRIDGDTDPAKGKVRTRVGSSMYYKIKRAEVQP